MVRKCERRVNYGFNMHQWRTIHRGCPTSICSNNEKPKNNHIFSTQCTSYSQHRLSSLFFQTVCQEIRSDVRPNVIKQLATAGALLIEEYKEKNNQSTTTSDCNKQSKCYFFSRYDILLYILFNI